MMMVLVMVNYINYILTIIGVFFIILSLFLIISEKIKGNNIYYNLQVKEKELRKAIDEAQDMINELVYTSEIIVDEIENYISSKKQFINNEDFSDIKKISNAEVKSGEIKNEKIIDDCIDENKKIGESFKNKILERRESKYEEVHKLLNQGLSIDEIAKKLKMGKGEVKLIITLDRGISNNENI